MNYWPLIVIKLEEFQEKFPEYSMGEIIYSVLIQVDKEKGMKNLDFHSLSHEQFYQAIHKAIRDEEE